MEARALPLPPALASGAHPPLVGRDDPLAALRAAWHRARKSRCSAGYRTSRRSASFQRLATGDKRAYSAVRSALVELYGVEDGEGTEYFRVHEGRDDGHAGEVRELIEERLSPADEDELAAAAESAFRANWRLLDGV